MIDRKEKKNSKTSEKQLLQVLVDSSWNNNKERLHERKYGIQIQTENIYRVNKAKMGREGEGERLPSPR